MTQALKHIIGLALIVMHIGVFTQCGTETGNPPAPPSPIGPGPLDPLSPPGDEPNVPDRPASGEDLEPSDPADPGTGNNPNEPGDRTITLRFEGVVSKAPVSGASVDLYEVTNDSHDYIGSVTSEEDGTFVINIEVEEAAPVYYLQASGGEYRDEATGEVIPLTASLCSYFTYAEGQVVAITPLSTILAARLDEEQALNMWTSLEDFAQSIETQTLEFAESFGVDTIHVIPSDPTEPLGDMEQPENKLAYIFATFSQMSLDLDLSNPMELVEAMATDYRDGDFDGYFYEDRIYFENGGPLPRNIDYYFESSAISFLFNPFNLTGLNFLADIIDLISAIFFP